MLEIKCDKCGGPVLSPGALIFSPPNQIVMGTVLKIHICKDCWQHILNWVDSDNPPDQLE